LRARRRGAPPAPHHRTFAVDRCRRISSSSTSGRSEQEQSKSLPHCLFRPTLTAARRFLPQAPLRAQPKQPLPPPSGAPPTATSESLISPWSPRPYATSSSFYAVGAEIHKRSPTRPILGCRLSADSIAEAPSIAPR